MEASPVVEICPRHFAGFYNGEGGGDLICLMTDPEEYVPVKVPETCLNSLSELIGEIGLPKVKKSSSSGSECHALNSPVPRRQKWDWSADDVAYIMFKRWQRQCPSAPASASGLDHFLGEGGWGMGVCHFIGDLQHELLF